MADSPNDIPITAPQPLRSALKHSSCPGTPQSPPLGSSSSPQNSAFGPRTAPTSTLSPKSSLSPIPVTSITTTSTAPSPPSATFLARPRVPSPAPASPAPLAAGYTPKVSFDTFENPSASMFSYTLSVKTDGYFRTRNTRVFLCAASPDESGMQALDWAIDALVQDGDELIVFRGVENTVLEKDHELVREEARQLMHQVQEKVVEYDPDRKLSIVVEFIAGKITDNLDRLIALYRPDSCVVGTRGSRGVIQTWGAAFGAPGMGSVSKYCLSHSPVPIIVVRPESKVRKAMAKRRANPKRGQHFEELLRDRTSPDSSPVTSPIPSSAALPQAKNRRSSGVPMSVTLTR